jgi:hypothetical protein
VRETIDWLCTAFMAVFITAQLTPTDVHLPKPPDPVPAPMPSEASYALAADDYLFVGADQPTLIRVSPAGLVEWEEAEAGTHHWKAGGAKKKYKTEHKHTYQFSAVGKGRAVVELFWAEGGAVKVRTITLDCQGARPPPVPPDPKPDPDTALGLKKVSADGAAGVADPEGRAALAKLQRAHASAVAAGAFANYAAILAGWRAANNRAEPDLTKLQAFQTRWKPWASAVSAKLSELFAAGKLQSNADWAAAFSEISEGLETK